MSAAVLSSLLVLVVLIDNASRGLDEVAGRLIEVGDEVTRQRDVAVATLERIPGETCTDDLLNAMRRAVFFNDRIIEIFFFPHDDVSATCSAQRGRLSPPLVFPKPDYDSPRFADRVGWMNLKLDYFGNSARFHVFKTGRFAMIADPSLAFYVAGRDRLQVYVPDTENKPIRTSFGDPNVYDEFLRKSKIEKLFAPYRFRCGSQVNYCFVLHKSMSEFVRENFIPLSLGLILSVGAGAIAAGRVARARKVASSLRGRVKGALRRRGVGFHCAYQPIVRLSDGAVIGCEVLARFEDRYGRLGPDEFIPVIEKLGDTWMFTEIMIRRSLDELKVVRESFPSFRISINFYPGDLCRENLANLTASAGLRFAYEQGLAINCEVLETGIGEALDMETAVAFLRGRGFTIAIDDFGTGSSNLAMLRRLEAEYLKIDKSFVAGLGDDDREVRSSLVPHIVEIAHLSNLAVVAEGIETWRQLEVLRNLGVLYGQGYLFSPPTNVDALERMARAGGAVEEPPRRMTG